MCIAREGVVCGGLARGNAPFPVGKSVGAGASLHELLLLIVNYSASGKHAVQSLLLSDSTTVRVVVNALRLAQYFLFRALVINLFVPFLGGGVTKIRHLVLNS